MTQTIRIRRGTKSEFINYGALEMAELGFCTDTKEVFIGDGVTNHLVGGVMMGTLAERPEASTRGRFYFVESGEGEGVLYFDDGKVWHKISVESLKELNGTLDDIADGVNYKKVKSEDIIDGHVYKVSDGINVKTAAEIKEHIDNPEIHRKINDAGAGNDELWSAAKIKLEIFNAIRGLDWQDSVKSKEVKSVPENPQLHDRYLIPADAEGIFSGKEGQIADWNGSGWDFFTPLTGWAVYVEDENKNYTYNLSGTWVVTGGANQTIETQGGLIGGGSGDVITLAVGEGNGITVSEKEVSVKAHHGIIADINGVSVKIDNTSIVFDEDNGYSLSVGVIDGGTF
ncbi:DUF2793 domain-containing protein [Ruminiclostridium herbifermentans]|uniref:DUF2793 domain-containing protein n=1 Tax=Ruminiclostridium herbifermentans TaxID=2488810 RepID=A0A4U7J8G2_9FIRM|nr:DUF2793 domain-containing protein [Ruminiclostridium herbifermentans]QNU65918.1 DUF2793 domain-containing protein [Ruminiclostridium herbifermentans]